MSTVECARVGWRQGSARETLPASRSTSGYMSVRGLAINGVQLRPVIAVGESVKNIAPHVEC